MKSLPTRRLSNRRRLLAEQLEDRRLLAGPYAPAAGEVGSTAVSKDDVAIVAWATGVAEYSAGAEVDAPFQNSLNAIGPAQGTSDSAVSLGRGGQITLTFEAVIRDGIGPDLVVFENAVNDTFLELGFVEVSSDGTNYFRFDNDSLTSSAVGAFGSVDPTEVHNLAGKYRQGFGTPFDLEELVGVSPLLDTTAVTHVRLIDIVGDGSQTDTSGDSIYDPSPTSGSAGLDVDAVGVIHQQESVRDVIGFEDLGSTLAAESAYSGPDPNGTAVVGPFTDTVVLGSFQSETLTFNNAHSTDFGSWNQWAYSNATNQATAGFTNQFSSFAGSGAGGSSTFGIGFPEQGTFYDPPSISRDSDDVRRFESLMVTNTTYAALSMRDGDSFAERFGGSSGNDPDFLLLTIDGKDRNDDSIGTIQFYLADYRFADNSRDYIVDQWVEVDLHSIAQARRLEFSITSSDVGPFGINTPTYFAVDDITLVKPVLPIDIADRQVAESDGDMATTVRISRPDSDTSAAINVTIAPVDTEIATVPTDVTIPVGQHYVEFPIDVVNNESVDGDRQLTIHASASGFVAASRSLTIFEDDARQLNLVLSQASIEEGGAVQATVSRNDADFSQALTVQIDALGPSLLSFDDTVTIEVGQGSATFVIAAVEDAVDRPDANVSVRVSAVDYVDASASLNVVDNDQPTITIEIGSAAYSESDAAPSSRLEDVGRRLPPESFYHGADGAGDFDSEGLSFNNQFDPIYGSWSGWAYSNVTDTSTAGFTNQYSAFAGGGSAGSDTYAVATAFSGTLVPTITRDPTTSQPFSSIQVTNTTYAALSMTHGDGFAKKFGGENGDDPDFFVLTIEGFDAGDMSVGTIEFPLADYRFVDNSLDYIVDEWTTVDLSPLTDSVQLRFSLDSSDVGTFGVNTPAYFAADGITFVDPNPGASVTLHRNVLDASEDLEVTLSSSDRTEIRLPATAVIPAGDSSVIVPLEVVDDAVVDGDQTVTLEVAAASHTSSGAMLTVIDNDVASLRLTVVTPMLVESDGEGRAVLHRNVADTDLSLNVELSVDVADQIVLPSTVTIPEGQRSVEFAFTVKDNAIVDGNRTVTIQAESIGFELSRADVSIQDEDIAKPTLTLEIDPIRLSESDSPPTAMLEDIGATLAGESFYNGADMADGFSSGPVGFNNVFDATFGSWGGWSVSNTTDTATGGFQNQYSAVTGGGANDSATYAVASAFQGSTLPSVWIETPLEGQSFESLMVTNTTYAASSMADGDAFAKKFGGPSGDDSDFFLLTIHGRDGNDFSVGTVEFYLADYRFEDNSQDYIVDQWTSVDVSSLVGATELQFSLSSSDVGEFGMNTPAYFAVDNIILRDDAHQTADATVTRSDADLSSPLVVHLSNGDSTEAWLAQNVVIPSGSDSVTFVIHAVDDAVVDGPQSIQITASASTHQAGVASLVIEDDDDSIIRLSLSDEMVDESAGALATQLLVHRNSQDLASALTVLLSASGDGIDLPASVTIPEGAASVGIGVGIIDNIDRDGDRVVSMEGSADGFAIGVASLHVRDDEISGLITSESDNVTRVGELFGQDEFQLSLASRPLSDVVVDIVYAADDVIVSPARLVFSPQEWNEPQVVRVEGVPDLQMEGDESVVLSLNVDSEASDPVFQPPQDMMLEITVQDHQPAVLRLGEDESTLFLADEEAGMRLVSRTLNDGIQVVANDLDQTIQIDALTRSRGLVQVDASGGNDTVVVRGTRFTSLVGGDGHDRLVLNLDVPIELVAFLDSRVIGFEVVVVASDSGAELTVDAQRLGTVASESAVFVIRAEIDQQLSFIGEGTLEQPIMVGDEFAQILRFGETLVTVVSGTPWQNVLSKWDVNQSGDVTALDALTVVNQLARVSETTLPALTSLEQFIGAFFDVSGDGHLTALDALRVINEVARRQLSGESELVDVRLDTREVGFQRAGDSVMGVSVDGPVRKIAAFSSPQDEAIRQLFPLDPDELEIEESVASVSLLQTQ